MSYAELHSRSAFSFLRGGSRPEELAEVAAERHMPALAVCDRDGVYSSPIFAEEAKEKGLRPIVGAEITLEDESVLPVLVENRTGYQNLCRLLTRAHLRAEKSRSRVRWDELPEFSEGLVALTGDEEGPLIKSVLGERIPWNADDPASLSSPRGEGLMARSDADRRLRLREGLRSGAAPQSDSRNRNLAPNPNLLAVPTPHPGPLPVEGRGRTASCAAHVLEKLTRAFGSQNVFVEIQRHHIRGEGRINNALVELAEKHRLPLLATNGVLYARPPGRQVLDVFTCLRHHTHLDAAGKLLTQNAERHLKSPAQMRELFHDLPEAIENTVRLADRLQFSLDHLGYEFPAYRVPEGHSMDSFLRERAFAGARKHYGEIPAKVHRQLKDELALIAKLGVAGYFLIVWDIAEFCRAQNIMSQGRGSAANSTVCFCLGITNVDPLKFNTLFERFLSEGRKNHWPDIDIDLPSGDRRERVIQEVYKRYGPRGAAMTANVITYRGRSAAREIGKVLNIGTDVLDRFSALFANGDFPHTMDLSAQMQQSGLANEHPRARAFVTLYEQIQSLPRHLGQHSGGMIICQDRLDSVVPLENASMPGRIVAQWDKDDCERMGIIKVDLLGLGMMSVLQDAVELTRQRRHGVDLANLPEDDPKTFAMIQSADTIGVFQIESRAQMATLPRMKPRCFYDLCIEVAIIRPGPIQGNLTHPYLKRRAGKERVSYYDESLEPVLKPILERTLGVPLFQEQMLEIAMRLAGFSGSEAEELRRALSFHRSDKEMQKVSGKLRAALEGKGHKPHVVEGVLSAITSFALYGFPESHAISFAHLAYSSAYLKAHCAPEFYTSLLNNQPMGFYSSATLIKDAQRHGLRFRPVCVMRSGWDCTLEEWRDELHESPVVISREQSEARTARPLSESALELRDAPDSLSPQRGDSPKLISRVEPPEPVGNTKIQDPRSRETPRTKHQQHCNAAAQGRDSGNQEPNVTPPATPVGSWVFGASLDLGSWCLDLPGQPVHEDGLEVRDDADRKLRLREGLKAAQQSDSRNHAPDLSQIPALHPSHPPVEDKGRTASPRSEPAIRLGLRVVRGLSEASARQLVTERKRAPFTSMEDFKRRVRLNKDELRTLAEIGALNCFAAHRREALWEVEREMRVDDLFGSADDAQAGEQGRKWEREKVSPAHLPTCSLSPLAQMNPLERLGADFTGMHLTTGRHPMALIRPQLKDVWRASDLPKARHGDYLRIAGNVICRQRPGTAKGFVFISLEDETGISNAIVRPDLFETLRLVITEESFLLIEGRLQNVDNVIHVRAEKIERLKHGQLVGSASYDFH